MSNRSPLPSLTAVLCWGGMFPIAATALDSIDAVHLNLVRYGLATIVFLGLLAAVEGAGALRYDGRFARVALLGAVGFAGFNLLTYAALETTEPQNAALVVATMPLMTVLVRWRMGGDAPPTPVLGFFVLALAGVALVVTGGDPASVVHGGVGAGELLVLGGVAAWVRYTLGAAELPDWSPLRYTALSAVGGVLAIGAVALAGDLSGLLSAPSGGDLADAGPQLAYIVLAGAVIAVLAWNDGVRRLGPANAALFINLVPVTTFAIEIARGYEPGVVEGAGALLTVGALVGANLAGRPGRLARRERREAGPALAEAV